MNVYLHVFSPSKTTLDEEQDFTDTKNPSYIYTVGIMLLHASQGSQGLFAYLFLYCSMFAFVFVLFWDVSRIWLRCAVWKI